MTVEQFVAARRDGWRRLAALCDLLADRRHPPDPAATAEFGDLYRRAAGDLAYARAHLGKLELTAWLNRLVARAHGLLYVRRRRGAAGLAAFFRDYPRRWRAAAPFLLTAAALLLGAMLLAYALVRHEPGLALLFVPAEVVESVAVMPDAAGNVPAGAFVALSTFIFTNNLTAGLLAFATGLFAGLGTVAALLKNGLLVGALAGLAHNTSPQALLAFLALVLPHGVIELAALSTCAAAGLKLGHALVAGGRVTRPAALRRAGAEAMTLLLGCLPWFAVAALIEGCFTPLDLPAVAKLLCAVLTASALIWYLRSSPEPAA
ncbi:MAG: stage II sporulation protein M [Armatimonadetes bacterium]|nr:stage II sporulation protein M [Armatimonadota bacterium]